MKMMFPTIYKLTNVCVMFQFIVTGAMGSCMSLQQKTTLTYFVSIER